MGIRRAIGEPLPTQRANPKLPAPTRKCPAFAERLERLELVLVDVELANSRLQRLPRDAEHRRRSVRAGYPALRSGQCRLDLFALAGGGVFSISISRQPGPVGGKHVSVC